MAGQQPLRGIAAREPVNGVSGLVHADDLVTHALAHPSVPRLGIARKTACCGATRCPPSGAVCAELVRVGRCSMVAFAEIVGVSRTTLYMYWTLRPVTASGECR
jgi:hypothetical protein